MSENFILKNAPTIDLALTLDCGQAFRWKATDDGAFEGIVRGKYLKIKQNGEDLIFCGVSQQDFSQIWNDYFDFDRDYSELLKRAGKNETLSKILGNVKGIRLLNQEPWEALCSFIISQNNNIPRIKGIIERLCENFGEKITGGYAFPSADVLAPLSIDDLAPLRCGFRAKYILDAALKCSSGEIDLENLKSEPFEVAKEKLMTIKGVGPKVADCTLLYGMKFSNAFPLDVWMKRAMTLLFPNGFPEEFTSEAGILQQYIFHYMRTCKDEE